MEGTVNDTLFGGSKTYLFVKNEVNMWFDPGSKVFGNDMLNIL